MPHSHVRATIEEWIANIPPLETEGGKESPLNGEIRSHWDRLTKPAGSLGRLESLAQWYGVVHGTSRLPEPKTMVCVFAADHGITQAGVSAYPSVVTQEMVKNFSEGGAAINVLTRSMGISLEVVDVGVNGNLEGIPGIIHRKVAPGTKNFLSEPAILPEIGLKAMIVGRERAHRLVEEGFNLLVTGEMGIGNTTASSALAAALLPMAPEEVTGRGTGLNDETYRLKVRVIEEALMRYRLIMATPLDWLWAVGGLEIAAIVGFIIGAAEKRTPVVLDGLITSAAALVAVRLDSRLSGFLLAGHEGQEPGHRRILEALSLEPVLRLGLRLGEGTGGVLAAQIVRSSVILYQQMATFESAKVSGPH
ncbi:MAG: nicotinate-nucleotide--dimethylbenzimidazole phosphoribosyltransferase [Leptospirales bacterium]